MMNKTSLDWLNQASTKYNTIVVVACWDKRRLIVPINYFIEKLFENWTRTTSELLATVLIYMDYTLPVDALRNEVSRLLTITKYWDGKANVVQVTNVTETNLEVRILLSAENSDKVFNYVAKFEKLLSLTYKNISLIPYQKPE